MIDKVDIGRVVDVFGGEVVAIMANQERESCLDHERGLGEERGVLDGWLEKKKEVRSRLDG
jgi:hypothetical protein